MHANTFSTFNSLENLVQVHELAKIRAHQLRREAINHFWAATSAWLLARLGRKAYVVKPIMGAAVHHTH